MSNANYLHQQLFAFSNHTLGKNARGGKSSPFVPTDGKKKKNRNISEEPLGIVDGGATEANQRGGTRR